jgi:RNA polymerase sigma-70 factor (ECF subfamily)
VRIPIFEDAAAVTAAEPEDVAALARQYGPAVFRAAWRILGSRAAAEDVQQQLFLRLLESMPRDVKSWPAYLTASAARMAIDSLRRQKRWRLLAPLWKDEPVDDSPQEDLERSEASRFLRGALARLKTRDAECFVMRHLNGMSPGDIGRELGISENLVSVSVHRARKALEAMQSEEDVK